MSSISNMCSNAGKAVEKLSRLEVVGMQGGNAIIGRESKSVKQNVNKSGHVWKRVPVVSGQ